MMVLVLRKKSVLYSFFVCKNTQNEEARLLWWFVFFMSWHLLYCLYAGEFEVHQWIFKWQ